MEESKKCENCKEIKAFSLFYKNRNNKDGLQYYCKVCADTNIKLSRQKKEDRITIKEQQRNAHLKHKYGLTQELFLDKLEEQHYNCAICNSKLEDKGHNTQIDHCHTTGKVRDILCQHCNRGLGSFKDSIENLKIAIKYLEKYKE